MTTATATRTEEKPRYRRDDALRCYLSEWAVGQIRKLDDHEVNGLWGGCRAPAAIALGYLEVLETRTHTHRYGSGSALYKTITHLVRRTDKQPPARRFRPPRPGSLWPWSLSQHWHVIKGSPCQTQREMFSNMLSTEGDDRWARHREIDDQFPQIRREGGLKHLRGQIAHIVRNGAYDVYDLRRNWYDAEAISTPFGLARMLAATMVRPVIENGRIARFEPLRPEEQMNELMRFPVRGLDEMLVEVYQTTPPAAGTKEE
jgi:hypothetical protein